MQLDTCFINHARGPSLRLAPGPNRPSMAQVEIYYYFYSTSWVPVDVAEDFVLMCNYTGKEVV